MPADAGQPADLARDLERFLLDLDRVYTDLESVLDAKREAFRQADTDQLAGVLHRERTLFTSIDSIENRRRRLVAETSRLSGRSLDPMRTTVTELAATLPPDDASRLQDMGAQVRQRIERVREQSRVLREVAEKLHLHMQSLNRRFHYAAGGSGVYERSGRFQSGGGAGSPHSVDFRR